MSNIILNLLRRIAARYGDTPSGYTGDVVKATKEIIKGEHTPYQAAIPSQRTYLFGEKNFPASTHLPVFDPSLPQYNVNFGADTLYVPKSDSILFYENLNKRVPMLQGLEKVKFPNGTISLFSNYSEEVPKYFYDAGRHSATPKLDLNGNPVMLYNDVYDFAGNPENYILKYSKNAEESPNWLRKISVKLMDYIGQPYEVHQTIPVKFIETDIQYPSNEEDFDRNLLNNILKRFNRLFKKPVDQLTDEEVAAALTNRNIPGDELIKEWESKGLLKKSGGKLNYLNLF